MWENTEASSQYFINLHNHHILIVPIYSGRRLGMSLPEAANFVELPSTCLPFLDEDWIKFYKHTKCKHLIFNYKII
jgi:hypothetical protein